jgi:N-methylhydantoinase A
VTTVTTVTEPKSVGYAIGVDIGGTFTDCVLLGRDGSLVGAKAPTTPEDRSQGFFASITRAAEKVGLTEHELLASADRLVHGTTTGTNAIVSRTGAKVGLITTAGHGDVMFLMRGGGRTAGLAPDEALHVYATAKPDPLVPRNMIVEVPERVDVDGDILVELDESAAREAIRHLVHDQGAEAIAISLIWAFRNQTHEHRLRELVSELAPGLFVCCASDLVSQRGEYERTTTAIMNAYIGPLMTRYIDHIETGAQQRGFPGRVLFAQCAGGAITGEEARTSPIRTVQSGPVAGIVSSQLLCEQLGYPNALLADMGGTTFDVSVIRNGEALRRQTSVFQRYELALPMLDVESVGAGGGSLAWHDESGRLNVGPQSAGAYPGPACYGHGNTAATVTDADVTLGIINPDTFLNGRMKVDAGLADQALGRVGAELSLDVHATAAGVNRIVDAKMADLIRRMSVLRGLDPRQFVMLAFGGGGPVHACAVAREAGVGRVVIPLPHVAAMWSALGAAVSDVTHLYQSPVELRLPVSVDQLNDVFAALEQRALDTITAEGFGGQAPAMTRTLRMKYAAQVFDVEVPMPNGELATQDALELGDRFGEIYTALFGEGSGYAEAGVEITNFILRATVVTPKPELRRVDEHSSEAIVERHRRPVYWAEEKSLLDTAVIRLVQGVIDEDIKGPALVELADTVVVVHPGQSASFDDYGNLVVEIGA